MCLECPHQKEVHFRSNFPFRFFISRKNGRMAPMFSASLKLSWEPTISFPPIGALDVFGSLKPGFGGLIHRAPPRNFLELGLQPEAPAGRRLSVFGAFCAWVVRASLFDLGPGPSRLPEKRVVAPRIWGEPPSLWVVQGSRCPFWIWGTCVSFLDVLLTNCSAAVEQVRM